MHTILELVPMMLVLFFLVGIPMLTRYEYGYEICGGQGNFQRDTAMGRACWILVAAIIRERRKSGR